MDPVWGGLPYDLVRRVLSLADLPIDTRLELKLENKKLNLKNFFKIFRNKVVYDNATQTLWDFRPWPEFYLKRKNYKSVFIEYNKYLLIILSSIFGLQDELNLSYS